MSAHPLRDRAALVGVGQTEFSKRSGRSELQLAAECTKAALEDAGLAVSDVDGFVSFSMDHTDEIELARTLGCGNLSFFSRIPHGGGAACGVVQQAAMAVATGIAHVVVCYRAMNGRSGRRMGQGISGQIITSDTVHWSWYLPYGLMTPAAWCAMYAQRYFHETGADSEDLGRIAVAMRAYAVRNPSSHFHGQPITLEDHQRSRPVVLPLRLLDCCQESDGGVAVVVTSLERARHLAQPPVRIRAAASGSGPDQEVMTSFYRDDITRLPELRFVAEQLYRQAGHGAKDVDAAILYDAFTSNLLMQIELFGFCGRGEAADFVREGGLGPEGRLPTNTHGGQLSEAYIHGLNGVAEGMRLVRGSSVNQPKKRVETVLVTAGTGVPTSGLILGKD